MRRILTVLVLGLAVPAFAQSNADSSTEETQQGYILMLHPHGGGQSRALAAFLTYEEAAKAENEWFATHPNSLDLPSIKEGPVKVSRTTRSIVGRNDNVEPPSGERKGTTITKPDLKFVDPGGRISSDEKRRALADKVLKGQIDGFDASFEFRKDGSLFIRGESAVVEGKWNQDRSLVQMETAKSRYRGQIKGGKLVGVVFSKIGSTPSTAQWEAQLEVEQPKNPLAGTSWKSYTSENKWRVWSFNADGTYESTYGGIVESDNSGRYSWSGDAARMSANRGHTLQSKVVGNRLELIGPSGKPLYFDPAR